MNMIFTLLKRRLKPSACFALCSEVSMTAFVKGVIHQDHSGFVKQGSPSKDDLQSAFEVVFNEYLRLSGDTSTKKLLSLLKEIAILSLKITLIEIIVGQLKTGHIPGLAEQLKKLGFRFEYADNENLQRELELTLAQSKQQHVQLDQAKAELEEMRAGDGKATTDQDFEMQYSAMGEFLHHEVNPDTTTVARYCATINRMKLRYQNSKK